MISRTLYKDRMACSYLTQFWPLLIGPYEGYTWVCAWAESVCQNCVLFMYYYISLFFFFSLRVWAVSVNFITTKLGEEGGGTHSLTYGKQNIYMKQLYTSSTSAVLK